MNTADVFDETVSLLQLLFAAVVVAAHPSIGKRPPLFVGLQIFRFFKRQKK